MSNYRSDLKSRARGLRKKMTMAEVKFCTKVKGKQISCLQFYRQRPLGKYIVDFYCPAGKIAVEIDGGQHYFDENIRHDLDRQKDLRSLGLRIIRFTNTEVLNNIEGVVAKLKEEFGIENPPSPIAIADTSLEKGG